MDRFALVIVSLILISGLAVVHFSLINAQQGLSPALEHGGTPPTNTPTFTVTPSFIHACYKNHKTDSEKQGQLRWVSDPGKCEKNETSISWTQ